MLVISILLIAILVVLVIIMWRQVAGPEKFANHGRLIQSGKSRAVDAFSRIRFAERAKLSNFVGITEKYLKTLLQNGKLSEEQVMRLYQSAEIDCNDS